MNFYKKLFNPFKETEAAPAPVSDNSQCPVCWGFQEYDQEVRTIYKDRLKDVTNKSFNFMRIQRLLREQIGGISSKNNIGIRRKRALPDAKGLLKK